MWQALMRLTSRRLRVVGGVGLGAAVLTGVALAGSTQPASVGTVIAQLGCSPTPKAPSSSIDAATCLKLAQALFNYDKTSAAAANALADMRSAQQSVARELDNLAGAPAAAASVALVGSGQPSTAVGNMINQLDCSLAATATSALSGASCLALSQFLSGFEQSSTRAQQGLADLRTAQISTQSSLDSVAGASEMLTLTLQQKMDQESQLFQTLSNIVKQTSETQDAIIQNLKSGVPDLGADQTLRLQEVMQRDEQAIQIISNIEKLISNTGQQIVQNLFAPTVSVTPSPLTLFVNYTLTATNFHPNSTVDFTLADPNFNNGIPYYHQAATTDANGSVTIINKLGHACDGLAYNLIFAITDTYGVTAATTVHVTDACP